MNLRRHILEAATLVLLAVLCALVANALASRERKLALVGNYPDALKIPEKKTGEKTGDFSAKTLSTPTAASTPADSGAKETSEASSKVNGVAPPGTAPLASEGGAQASAKLPFKEKRPGPASVSTPKASAPPQGSEARITSSSSSSSSPAELIKRFPPHNKPYVGISGEDAAWLVARGALVLDARRTRDYELGHIAGARAFPVWESDIDARVTALVAEGRDGAIPVVLYCSGGDCEDSHMLAQKLFGAGFNNLLVYRDGWPDWVSRKGKSVTGPES